MTMPKSYLVLGIEEEDSVVHMLAGPLAREDVDDMLESSLDRFHVCFAVEIEEHAVRDVDEGEGEDTEEAEE